jgi:hypothetical protein
VVSEWLASPIGGVVSSITGQSCQVRYETVEHVLLRLKLAQAKA